MNQDSSIALLADRLRAEVRGLRPGDRLPTSRALTERHRVSPVTVTRALSALAAEGLVVTRPGSGTYVAERPEPATADAPDFGWQAVALAGPPVSPIDVSAMLPALQEGMIPLSGGYLHPSLQPLKALAQAAGRALRRPDAWQRPPDGGLRELRGWFARATGPRIAPDDVLVTGGGQAALSTALRAILTPGDALLVESPTYPGVLAAARAAGLRTVPVPVDENGVRPDLLADAFAVSGARAFYTQPAFHNPTGAVLAPGRRRQVLDVARAAGAFVIEDDFARQLAIVPAPPPLVTEDADGTVVHLASLTKITAPSMRIAAVIARGPVAERLRSLQAVDTFFPARPLQETALELTGSPAWPRHLAAVRTALRSRRDALLAAVARDLPQAAVTPPGGGLHLWLRLPYGMDEQAIADGAARAGVTVGAGRPFHPAEPPGPRLRLSYSLAASEAELAEGVRRVAAVIAALRPAVRW